MKIKVMIECSTQSDSTIKDICNNFGKYYGYLGKGKFMVGEFYYVNSKLHIIFEATIPNLLTEERTELIGMTRHAEKVYENIDVQDFRCEVFIDGKWYRKTK